MDLTYQTGQKAVLIIARLPPNLARQQ